jgi:hypothetical protein
MPSVSGMVRAAHGPEGELVLLLRPSEDLADWNRMRGMWWKKERGRSRRTGTQRKMVDSLFMVGTTFVGCGLAS